MSSPKPSPAHSVAHPREHSRKTSASSHMSKLTADQDAKNQVLDRIHTAASRAEGLTTFQFGSPPRPPSTESKGIGGDIVPGGLSSLYSRLRATVGGPKEQSVHDLQNDALLYQGGAGSRYSLANSSMSGGTTTPTSRLQSPSAPTFAASGSIAFTDPSKSAQSNTLEKGTTPTTPAVDKRTATKELTGHRSRTQSPATNSSKQQHYGRGELPIGDGRNTSHVRQHGNVRDNSAATESTPSHRPSRKPREIELLPPIDIKGLERPPLIHVSQSHLPGFRISQDNSVDDEMSSTRTGSSSRMKSKAVEPQMAQRQALAETRKTVSEDPAARLKSKVLAKELWMRDETAKECFYCGEPFSTFRRKHHCRICGNIFDGKCTNLVPGRLFGQSGSLRICRPCEGMVYGNDDDSSNYTDDGDRSSIHGSMLSPKVALEDSRPDVRARQFQDDLNMEAPTLGIPVARKGGESKRGSAVIEFTNEHSLARPSSSRSLKSLSGLHRVANHKRHHSRQVHQHMKSLRSNGVDHAPFQRGNDSNNKSSLPALHYDNIIDPDLAQFMSDEELSEDDATSIFATLNADVQSPGKDSDRALLTSMMAASKRKTMQRDRGGSTASRDADNVSLLSKGNSRRRLRNPSIGSLQHPSRSSPRRTKSNSLLRGFNVGSLAGSPTIPEKPKLPTPPNGGHYKMIRSSAMRGASAPAVELNQASLQHVRNLLKQMIRDANIPEAKRWEKALLPILLQCTDDVNPDIHRNDDIDIRHYIKLKKIPGAKPGDTAYVSGVVFTKNLALKSMPRSLHEPRVLIVTFPIEYARHHTHFMSLDPVIAQEKEYLSNLIKRIVALNPSVLLVEKNVSGLALGYLEDAGIAVVYNVKASVLSAVSRCTKTKLITSVDKLSLGQSELGHCESFGVKTYVHDNLKKTYIYFSGCQKDLGCTIVLRGAQKSVLRKIKRIAEFMSYVVYNLKLETCVMRDEYVLIPVNTLANVLNAAVTDQVISEHQVTSLPRQDTTGANPLDEIASTAETRTDNEKDTHDVASTADADTIKLSTTSLVGSDSIAQDQRSEALPSSNGPSFHSDIVKEHETRITSSSPFVKFTQPHLLRQVREQEVKLIELRKLRDQYTYRHEDEKNVPSSSGFELVQPEMVHKMVEKPSKPVKDFLFAVHDAEYEAAKHSYQTQRRQWEAYLSNNSTMFDPSNHQRIACLYSMVNSKTNPCVGPELIALSFYGEHDLEDEFLPDITLGQYIEELCQSGEAPCSAEDCGDTMFKHHRQYVHGDGQMNVTIQPHPARIRGMQKTILMWSACRICGQETHIMPMSENTWKYSFGKYLELTFWSTALSPRAHTCPHDIHRDHVRFFGFNNVAVRVQYDAIQIYDIIPPRPTIHWKVDKDLLLKNEQYNRFKTKIDRFMKSVKLRIESIHVDSMPPDKVQDCQTEVESLLARAKEDHNQLTRKLQEKYMESRWYEIIPLNRAARAIQEVSIEWDALFAEFESNFFPSEKDIRRMTALQLKKLFESATSFTTVDEPQDDEDGEVQEKTKVPLIQSPPEITRRISVMSPEDTKNVLVSAIQDQHADKNPSDDKGSGENTAVLPLPMTQPTAVDVENMKHLDLAISSEQVTASTELDSADSSPSKKTSSSIPRTEGLSTIEKLDEQIKDSHMTDIESTSGVVQGSRIPRPIESTRFPISTHGPPLNRSQSQPQGLPQLSGSSIGLDPSEDTPIPPLSKTDKFRYLLSEPARAFERSMVGRIASRGKHHPSLIPRSVPGKRNVLNLARHYEQLTREFEKQRRLERQMRDTRGAYPLASSKPVVEVYRDAHEAVKENDTIEDTDVSPVGRPSTEISNVDTSHMADAQVSHEVSTSVSTSHTPTDVDQQSTLSHNSEIADTIASLPNTIDEDETTTVETDLSGVSPEESQLDLSQLKEEKTSVLRMLANFWSERTSSGWLPLEYPFAANEHVWGDSDIVVREDEPSSIIALALSSADYLAKLRAFRKEPLNATVDDVDVSIERNLLHSKNTNIRYAFQNRGVRAQCKIFYAESFDALRRKCGISERFVESLSRCLKWDSKGGKTKSLFLKTLDDRFVLKSLSAVEVNSFFKFAPDYFVYAHAMLFNGLPSVIAKMLGLFQVTIRNPASGMEFNWFMIVMENLFYDRSPNRRFDLKGSMRNRKIQSTGEIDEVLLDENLVDIIFEKPIFVREHTMKMLTASVWNDTLFLSKQNVMDYSLMAGFEDDRREIVVGIIDCIRTYTWDKKLETWIKDRGKNKPTVTSPKDYRNRFRVAMSKYILLAPNCWHQFQAQQIQGRPVTFAGHAARGDEELLAGIEPSADAPTLGRMSTGAAAAAAAAAIGEK